MAKQAAPPVSTITEGKPQISVPPQAGGPPLVVEWNNEAQDAGMDVAGAVALEHDPETGKAKLPSPADALPEPKNGATRGADGKFQKGEKSAAELAVHGEDGKPDDDAAPVEDKKEEPAPVTTSAEKRAAALANLEHERRLRTLETTLKSEQEGRKADREAREAAEKMLTAIKGGTLGDLLAARGLSHDEALEALLKGGDQLKVTGAAPKPETPEQKTLAALQQQVKDLTEQLATRTKAEEQAQMQATMARVADATKELDIPVTRAVDGGLELVLRTAHELWLAGGSRGLIADHFPEAGQLAEEHWREQKPALAKLADEAKGARGNGKPKDAAQTLAARSISRRTGADPTAKPKSLWQKGPDGQPPSREEVDLQIKREMGFQDRT